MSIYVHKAHNVTAVQLPSETQLQTGERILRGKAGDWLTYSEAGGWDMVRNEVFVRHYAPGVEANDSESGENDS